ncbi:MAG: transcriptional repressor [Gemmatimonadaceae bacterium]|jgi:Fur family ferric uptake transcriptional regulator|nr:transcriptional repressor [Gemmatimonadaceae bacterium]
MERNTRQRAAIRQVFEEQGRPLSPGELLDAARLHVPSIGIATVYRTIKAMADDGEIITVDVPGEPPRYERAHLGHHHHFHCRGCDRVYEVHGCPGDIEKLAPTGFKLDGHAVMLFGRCDGCLAA